MMDKIVPILFYSQTIFKVFKIHFQHIIIKMHQNISQRAILGNDTQNVCTQIFNIIKNKNMP